MQDRIAAKLQAFSGYVLESRIRLVIFFVLLLFATFMLSLWQYGWVINDDGALYLYAAKNFSDHGLSQALDTYPWAYYSILIAYINNIFFNNLAVSGWTLNFIFQCGQIYYLYRICSALHIGQPKLFWALVLFVISVGFHNFRNYLMRDQGFLLFAMAGVYYSLLFIDKKQIKVLTLFIISFVIAALFRIEALILFIFGFTFVIYLTRQFTLVLISMALLLLLAGLALSLYNSTSFAQLFEYISFKVPDMMSAYAEKRLLLETKFLSKYWLDHSDIALLGLYISSYFYYLLSSLSIYVLGLFYLPKKPLGNATLLLAIYGAAIIFYCLVFLLDRGFLVFRYNLPLTYILTLLSIILVLSAYARKAKYSKLLLTIFIIVPLFKVFDAPSGSKRYLLEAQSKVEEMGMTGESVYSNTLQISLINGIDYQQAAKLKNNEQLILNKIKTPLEKNMAVIYYGDVKTNVIFSEENCMAYYMEDRSRSISVFIAKNSNCLPVKG